MDTVFMTFENSETSNPHRLLLHFLDKIMNLKKGDKYVALINLNM